MDIFKHRHQLGDKEVRVSSLPRQVRWLGDWKLSAWWLAQIDIDLQQNMMRNAWKGLLCNLRITRMHRLIRECPDQAKRMRTLSLTFPVRIWYKGLFPALRLRFLYSSLAGSVGCASDWRSGGCGLDPRRVGNILSWRFDHEIFSTIILCLPLIREGQLLVSGKKCAQYWLTA